MNRHWVNTYRSVTLVRSTYNLIRSDISNSSPPINRFTTINSTKTSPLTLIETIKEKIATKALKFLKNKESVGLGDKDNKE